MTFSPSDFDLLLEAVELWETRPLSDMANSEFINALTTPRKPGEDSAADMARVMRTRMEEADKQNRGRRERGVMLRAKLIQLRDSAAAEAVTVTINREQEPDHA